MHIALFSYVQVPVAYISSLVLIFFNILYIWAFLSFSEIFEGKLWGFSP